MQTCILVPISLKCSYLHAPNILWVFWVFFLSLSFGLHFNFKCHWKKISAWLMRLNCFISNYPCQAIAINQFLKSITDSFRTMSHHFVISLFLTGIALLSSVYPTEHWLFAAGLGTKNYLLPNFPGLPLLSSILLYLFPPTLGVKPRTSRKLKTQRNFLLESTTSGIRYPLGELVPANSSLLSLPVNHECKKTNFLESSSENNKKSCNDGQMQFI